MPRLRRAFGQVWPRVAIITVLILIWWAVNASGFWNRALLPSPASVWTALWSNLTGGGGLLVAAERSVLRLVLGLAAAAAIGTPIGLAMAASKIVQRSVGSVLVGLQALPSIAWLPLATLWFGITEKAVFFVVVMGATPAVAIATAASVRLVPPTLVRAARTLGSSGARLYVRVVLPAAIPGFIVGLQQAWTLAWRALMAAELLVTGARGLGHVLERTGAIFDTPLMLATMVVIMLVGISVDALFALVDRRVRSRRGLVPSG